MEYVFRQDLFAAVMNEPFTMDIVDNSAINYAKMHNLKLSDAEITVREGWLTPNIVTLFAVWRKDGHN